MKLSIHTQNECICIEISPDQFTRLHHPHISREEIETIAAALSVPASMLLSYVSDLRHDTQADEEIDSSCDYTDHFA